MTTLTGTILGSICPTANYPSPTASAENPWGPSTVSIWVGSFAAIVLLIFTLLYAMCKEAAWMRAKLCELNKDILAVLQRGVDGPEQQWILDLLLLEREKCAQGYFKYLYWANWYKEPPMPVTMGPAERIALARLDRARDMVRDLVARQSSTTSAPQSPTQSTRQSPIRRRRERQSLSWQPRSLPERRL